MILWESDAQRGREESQVQILRRMQVLIQAARGKPREGDVLISSQKDDCTTDDRTGAETTEGLLKRVRTQTRMEFLGPVDENRDAGCVERSSTRKEMHDPRLDQDQVRRYGVRQSVFLSPGSRSGLTSSTINSSFGDGNTHFIGSLKNSQRNEDNPN